jgi:hypothetical protein
VNQIKSILITLTLITITVLAKAQTTLNANGPGQTYELINSVLAPGYVVVEAPDQCSSHPQFGRHIAEVWDSILNKFVFEFYIHVPTAFPVTTTTADNDRCINFDRQRVEIKTYDQSPSNLKGTVGETVTYKWQFRLPLGFQPSPNFTHIHQVKAVDGDDDDPIFTLTARAGTTNLLQLIHVDSSVGNSNVLKTANLSLFQGTWVEATETILVGQSGTYNITIKRISDGVVLLTHSATNIKTIRAGNAFIRPKWGIYRSLNTYTFLRDDSIRLGTISIQEGVLPVKLKNFLAWQNDRQIRAEWIVGKEVNVKKYVIELSDNNNDFYEVAKINAIGNSAYSYSFYNLKNAAWARLKIIDNDGTFSYSTIVKLNNNWSIGTFNLFPNPAHNELNVVTNRQIENGFVQIINMVGKIVFQQRVGLYKSAINISTISNGQYILQLLNKNKEVEFAKPFIKTSEKL